MSSYRLLLSSREKKVATTSLTKSKNLIHSSWGRSTEDTGRLYRDITKFVIYERLCEYTRFRVEHERNMVWILVLIEVPLEFEKSFHTINL